MARDYDTILREALELDAVDRAKLIDEVAASLAREAGIGDDPMLYSRETSTKLDDNLRKARALEDARIEAAVAKAKKRRDEGE